MYVPQVPEPWHPGWLDLALPDRHDSKNDESRCEQNLDKLKKWQRLCQARGKKWRVPKYPGCHKDNVEVQDSRDRKCEDPARMSHQVEFKPGNDCRS
jgi:hypothetical protein